MPLNLITDAWIPIRTTDDERRVIRPDQIAEPGIARPDWPRADFNLACLELLVGLVFLADPPRHAGDWSNRRAPDPDRLHDRLAPLAPAFDLGGDGPRFLQDFDQLDVEPQPIDMLIIDCPGMTKATLDKNVDLMVKRYRYGEADPAWAAMALYTCQSQTQGAGGGHRSSMRGRGPLIVLVQPHAVSVAPLWDLVWANVPNGRPLLPDQLCKALPWMRPTKTSEKGTQPVPPPDDRGMELAEAFFGMPQRIRLLFSDAQQPKLQSILRKKSGTNYLLEEKNKKYALWQHPLSPYVRKEVGGRLIPVGAHRFCASYRNWIGIGFQDDSGLRVRPQTIDSWLNRTQHEPEMASCLVGGWHMDPQKTDRVLDFLWSSQPLFPFDHNRELEAIALVRAANAFALALAMSLKPIFTKQKDVQAAPNTNEYVEITEASAPSPIEATREEYYFMTQLEIEKMLLRLYGGEVLAEISRAWINILRSVALSLFDANARPVVSAMPLRVKKDQNGNLTAEAFHPIVRARSQLLAAFEGWGPKTGQAAYKALGLELPKRRKAKTEEAA